MLFSQTLSPTSYRPLSSCAGTGSHKPLHMDLGEENGLPNSSGDVVSAVVDDARRPFDVICDGLTAMGALSIDDFLNNASSASAVFDVSFHLQLPDILSSMEKEREKSVKTDVLDEPKPGVVANGKPSRNAVALLRQTCESVLGSFEALSYDYLENDPKNRQCILTITRPNGGTRAYRSEAGPHRRAEAKAQAAQIAIDMGAIDFITSGDSDALKAKKGLLANPLEVDIDQMDLDESPQSKPRPPSRPQGPLREIQDCCDEWRAGKVKPHFVFYNDSKNKKKHGAAMRISLIAHVFRAYSVDPVYDTPSAAKHACARLALSQGVKEFIMYGNGQTEPQKVIDDGREELMPISRNSPAPFKGITLQDYYETLPQPFPEDVGNASAVEINGPAWLNLALQSARGARLVSNFIPIMDTENRLHGCLLRIERPAETRTFFIDPQFLKRSDARSAVCLLAMSQGVGDYIRGLKEEAENKLPEERRKLANEKLLQTLAAECGKVRPGNRLAFLFVQERDAFGCTLKVDISPNADEPDIREYVAKTEYRAKADAKAAVACIAAEQGLVDLLRFKGGPLPPDYVPFWDAQVNGDGDTYVSKRKELEREVDGEGRDRKKRKKGNKDNVATDNLEISSPRPPIPRRGQAKSKQQHSEDRLLPPKPYSLPPTPASSVNSRWKNPHATSSRGLGPTDVYASASRSVGQDRSGSRSGGPPKYPRGRPNVIAHYSEVSSYSRYERSPREYSYDDRMDYGRDPSYRPPPPPPLPPADPYGGSYSRYPSHPPVQSHYPSSGYVSSSPASPHHYQTYYGAPPTPPHDPYHGHYIYPPPYISPQPYPHSPYPVGYPSHPPVIYSPHPPPMAIVPPSPPTMTSADPYPTRYPSTYPTRSPSPPYAPPPISPPRHSHHAHHASDYAIIPESNRYNMNNHRRHSTIADSSRHRHNNYRRPQRDERGWYEDDADNRRPSPPPHSRWPRRDSDYGRPRSRSPTPSRTNSNSEQVDPRGGSFQEAEASKSLQTPVEEHQPVQEEVKQEPEADMLVDNSHSLSEVVKPDTIQDEDVVMKPTPPHEEDISAQTPDVAHVKEDSSKPSPTVGNRVNGQQSRTMTNLEILNEFCVKKNIVKPTFYHQVVHEQDGSKAYIVWAEKDAQRMALKNHFKSIEEGYEKLSKSVLQYERSKLARK